MTAARQHRITDGLIIREYNKVGEADRFVTALTRDFGLLRASARGARSVKSRNAAATRLLSYTRLSLIPGKSHYIIEDAKPIHSFFELHSDIEKLALAQYFCELAGVAAPREEPAERPLRLLLNALHYLAGGGRDQGLVKATVELRLLAETGYMPELGRCAGCGAAGGSLSLLATAGVLRCAACAPAGEAGWPLSAESLAAMRHIVYGDFERIFALDPSPDGCRALAAAAEAFTLAQLGRGFGTLDFYRSLLT